MSSGKERERERESWGEEESHMDGNGAVCDDPAKGLKQIKAPAVALKLHRDDDNEHGENMWSKGNSHRQA